VTIAYTESQNIFRFFLLTFVTGGVKRLGVKAELTFQRKTQNKPQILYLCPLPVHGNYEKLDKLQIVLTCMPI